MRSLANRVVGAALGKLMGWAIARNAPGGYIGESDKRWAYTIETEGKPYLSRLLFPRMFGFRPMLHHFHRVDSGHLHNHPWTTSISFILAGAYDETRLDTDLTYGARAIGSLQTFTETKRVRWFNVIRAFDFYKVDRLHGDVWTLFITGKPAQDWGFYVDGNVIPWRKYLGKDSNP